MAKLPVQIQVSAIIIINSKAGVACKVSLRNCKSSWRSLKAQVESPISSWTVWRAPSIPSPAPCTMQARRGSASCQGKLTLIARSGRTAVTHWQQRGMLLTHAGSAWSVLVLPFPVLNLKGKRQAIGFYICFYYIYPTIHFSYINPNIFSDCPSVVVEKATETSRSWQYMFSTFQPHLVPQCWLTNHPPPRPIASLLYSSKSSNTLYPLPLGRWSNFNS